MSSLDSCIRKRTVSKVSHYNSIFFSMFKAVKFIVLYKIKLKSLCCTIVHGDGNEAPDYGCIKFKILTQTQSWNESTA